MAMGSKIELGRVIFAIFFAFSRELWLILFHIVLYVFFPVAMFFYFNMPESYEDFMTQKKKELYPADEDCNRPPTTIEDIKKAREIMLEARRKEKAQQETDA